MSRYANIIKRNIEKLNWINRIDLYESKGSNQDILDILEQGKNIKKWGCFMENITKDIFGFGDSENTEHDFKYGTYKIELKSSCLLMKDLLNDRLTFQYNSIRMDYDYEYIMLCNVNLEELDYYICEKTIFKNHIERLNLKQKKLKVGILELITFERIKEVMEKVEPEDFVEVFNQL